MNNFDFHLSTRIHFGKGSTSSLKDELLRYGKKVLFVYDEIPVKASGLYEQIIAVLKEAGCQFTEFTGVEPNPRHTTVNRGIELCRSFGAECIIAAGGGSTLDCGKAIGFGSHHDGDVWDFYSGKATIKEVTPVIAIPTLAAAGAEVSWSAVLSNMEKRQKIGLRNPLIRPAVAILDPTFTFSVPRFHTACGVVDIMSHTYETYFGPDHGTLQDGFAEALMRSCIESGRKVMAEPTDYDARATLMWCADLSISQITSRGRSYLSSPVHSLEHILSAYYDIVHGAGIAIVSLAWFRYCLSPETAPKFAQWARNVWGITADDDMTAARAGIAAFESFCKELGLPTHMGEVNITKANLEEIAQAEFPGLKGTAAWFRPVSSKEELLELYSLAL